MIVDFKKYDKDPLELIVRHKDIVRHLRGNGVDGFEIKKILDNDHGRNRLNTVFGVLVTKRDIAKHHKIDYAMRHVKALVNNEAITDDERGYLFKVWSRLSDESFPLEKDKSGGMVYKIPKGKGDAKTDKQATGRQVAAINKYIRPFNNMYLQKAIFNLIAELFEVRQEQKYTHSQIANFDKNNC